MFAVDVRLAIEPRLQHDRSSDLVDDFGRWFRLSSPASVIKRSAVTVVSRSS